MVQLTKYEQQMFDGDMGEFKQLAMRFIVRYANVLGYQELCEVNERCYLI